MENPNLRVIPGRIVFQGQVAHQLPNEQPTAISLQYVKQLESDEQPYQRRCKVGEEWEVLDLGWIEGKVSLIAIANLEGSFTQVNPTEEEKAESSHKILQIGCGNQALFDIPPKETFVGSPSSVKELRIRCLSGYGKFNITIYPA